MRRSLPARPGSGPCPSPQRQRRTAKTGRRHALANAIENAKVLAKAAGLNLKGITYIQFVPNMMQPGGMELALAEGEAVTPILPGQINVESYVNLTYEIAR
ncbi:MAG: SIMPL domain-containing protein [Desulfomonilia bacterium]